MDDLNNQQELREGSELQNGRYRIVRKLGQGGFGITYEGVQTGLERTVAIKEFFMKDYCNRDDATNSVSVGTKGSAQLVDNFRKKFLKEARFIAQLGDVPHVVRIHDIFEENGTAYYVMEYVNGGSLKQLVAGKGALSEQKAISYITQIGQALHSLHQHNILHLDVKPDNVLLNSRGEAVLIDFGVSKRYDQTGSQTSTTPIGLSKGYAPFEQYKDGGMELFTPATDIYSLGATLYYLLAGHTPPEADEIMENGLAERPTSVSPAVWNAIEQAMQPLKKNRPQSVDVFLAMLGTTGAVLPPVVDDDNSKTVLSSEATSIETVRATQPKSMPTQPQRAETKPQSVATKLQQPAASTPPPVYKKQALLSKQTMIALLLFVGTIVCLLLYRYGMTHNFFDYGNYDDIEDWDAKWREMEVAFHRFWRNFNIIWYLLPLIGYVLLYRLASNRSVRFFTLMSAICCAGGILTSFISYQLIIRNYTSGSDVNETLMKIIGYAWFALDLGVIYAQSVLLNNNVLSDKNKTWVGVLMLCRIMSISVSAANIVTGGLVDLFTKTKDSMSGYNDSISYQDLFDGSGLYAMFWQILTLFTAFAFWHLARSEAFSKPYNATEPVRLTPLNKWMGAAVTGIVIVTIGLYLLYTTLMREFIKM